MPIYFAQQGDHGPVKIGLSVKPYARIAFLKTSSPEPIHLRRLFEGGPAEEAALHERFAAYRLTGEWFKPVDEILTGEIGLPPLRVSVRTRKGEWTEETRNSFAAKRAAQWADREWVERTAPHRAYYNGIASVSTAMENIIRLLSALEGADAVNYQNYADAIKNRIARQRDRIAAFLEKTPDMDARALKRLPNGGAKETRYFAAKRALWARMQRHLAASKTAQPASQAQEA